MSSNPDTKMAGVKNAVPRSGPWFRVEYPCEPVRRIEIVYPELITRMNNAALRIFRDVMACQVCKQMPYDCKYFVTEIDIRSCGHLDLFLLMERLSQRDDAKNIV